MNFKNSVFWCYLSSQLLILSLCTVVYGENNKSMEKTTPRPIRERLVPMFYTTSAPQ
jgi:hypothetical protein